MGSSSNDDPVQEAQAAEAAKQAQIDAAIAQINALFSSPEREAQYADYLGARRGQYTDEVNRQQGDAVRNLKFALARSGLTGGSVAVDKGREQGQTYDRALIDAERLAQGDTAQLRGSDQQSKLSLEQMVQSGLDATTGIANANSAMQTNLLSGQSTRGVQALGDIFKDYTDFYRKSRDDQQRRAGEKYAYNTLYSPSIYSGVATQ